LIGGSAQSPPLVHEEGGVPKIIADPSRFSRLTGSLTELLEDISTMIENGNRLLSEENAAHLTRSLENLSEFSGALAGQSEEVFQGVKSLSRVSQEAEQLLHRVNGLVDNQGQALVSNGAQTMASLQSATASLDRLLRENEDGLTGGIQGLNALGPALEELRRTMATLRDVAQRFDNNPGGYLFSRETVREFQP
jgi:phospholipid/cholesterol/gamma-HCH transport system substrate-binding protein